MWKLRVQTMNPFKNIGGPRMPDMRNTVTITSTVMTVRVKNLDVFIYHEVNLYGAERVKVGATLMLHMVNENITIFRQGIRKGLERPR